jgi:GNAT superfamily N-acetyltransferase
LPPAWQAASEDTVLRAGASTGYARRIRIGPDDPRLLWGAADRLVLRPNAVGPDLAAGLDGVLTAWRRWLTRQPEPADEDSAATVNWPSRDVRALPALRDHGLSPYSVIAVRRSGSATPPAPPRITVRRATAEDLDAVAGLGLSLLRYEADLGTAYLRDRAGEWIRAEIVDALAAVPPWIWVAEQDGLVVGMVEVQPPPASAWLEQFTSARPVAYVSSLFVDPASRGSGLGTALVAAAHRAVDAAGMAVTLLHYAQVSPVSGPFWHRAGYRPLWTSWQARPAGTLR